MPFSKNELRQKPSPTEIEVTLFGRGVGESILIHLGDYRFCVIDSFRHENKPVILSYLEALDIPTAKVEFVAATHFHDDHTKGLAEIMDAKNPGFLITQNILTGKNIITALLLKGEKLTETTESANSEFSKILKCSEKNKIEVKDAGSNKLMLQISKDEITHNQNVQVYSLSPQDIELRAFIQSLEAEVYNETKGEKTRTNLAIENHVSIVLWVKIGETAILLGSDLEKHSKGRGWCAVVDNFILGDKAEIFKIPHHGSENGHHNDVWDKMVCAKPISILSVFKTILPTETDIERIRALSKHTLIAGKLGNKKRKEDKAFERDLEKLNVGIKIDRPASSVGIIRLRKELTPARDWTVEKFGEVAEF